MDATFILIGLGLIGIGFMVGYPFGAVMAERPSKILRGASVKVRVRADGTVAPKPLRPTRDYGVLDAEEIS